MKIKTYITAAFFAALAGTASVQAAPVVGSDGVNMGNVTAGRIFNAKDLTPNTLGLWTSNAAWSRTVAPVANFTGVGFDTAGAAFNILYANLIPLKTSSLRTVDAAGNTIFLSDSTGNHLDDLYLKDSDGSEKLVELQNGQLLVGGAPAAGGLARHFIQLQGAGLQYPVYIAGDPVASRIYFGQQTNAFSAGHGSVFPSVTAGTITLKAGRTYKLTFNAVRFGTWYTVATTPILFFQFKNVTTGQFFGPPGTCENNQPVANNYGILTAFISPSVDTVVALEVQGSYNGPTLTNPELIVETAD